MTPSQMVKVLEKIEKEKKSGGDHILCLKDSKISYSSKYVWICRDTKKMLPTIRSPTNGDQMVGAVVQVGLRGYWIHFEISSIRENICIGKNNSNNKSIMKVFAVPYGGNLRPDWQILVVSVKKQIKKGEIEHLEIETSEIKDNGLRNQDYVSFTGDV